MAKADRVHSTPPTNTSLSRHRSYGLLEGSISDVFHMSNIVENELSEADGTSSSQQLERLVFCVNHLCKMVDDLHTEYFQGTEVSCGKAVA
jgi:hypothetical protein